MAGRCESEFFHWKEPGSDHSRVSGLRTPSTGKGLGSLAGAIAHLWAGVVICKRCLISTLSGPVILDFFSETADYCGSPAARISSLNVLYLFFSKG